MNLFWLQCGSCSGDSMSLLNMDSPGLLEALAGLGVEVLWHPSLSGLPLSERRRLDDELVSGRRPLDILVVEGAILEGPGGTGMYDSYGGKPKKALVEALARRARFVIAVGTCACFGGVAAAAVEATGLQFRKTERGGLLGRDFVSGAGLPVINLAGCPNHPEVVIGALSMLTAGIAPPLDAWQRPIEWFGIVVHQGCTRNEYHEFRVEEKDFGDKGCLFFHMGCQGPLTHGPCNKILWNRRTTKTRAGIPCHGCTSPDFPRPYPILRTREIEGIPMDIPEGVKRAHYMVYKNMAAAATPERLKARATEV